MDYLLITPIVVILLIASLILWQEKKLVNSMHERLKISNKKFVHEKELSLFEKFDIKKAKSLDKKMRRKFAKPSKKLLLSSILLYVGIFILYRGVRSDNIKEIIIISLLIAFSVIIIYYTVFIPSYYKLFEEYFPSSLRTFAQEVSYGGIRESLERTGEYAHPEMARVCQKIARLNRLGLSIEEAVLQVIPGIKSESLIIFLAVLRIHDRSGGRLVYVLNNLSDFFNKQFLVRVRADKVLIESKLALYFSILYYPCFLLFFYFYKEHVFDMLINDPSGWYWNKIIIATWSLNVLLNLYILRNKGI